MDAHDGANTSVGNPFLGLFKPARSDVDGTGEQPDGFFPVLVIFVQFPNDPSTPGWPAGQPPDYLSTMIATSKQPVINGQWWNAYNQNTESLSDQYKEISRGHLDLVSPVPNLQGSGAYHVLLSKTPKEYWLEADSSISGAELIIYREIWDSVTVQGLEDWRPYDRWRKIGNQYYFTPLNQGDSIIDMIYKVHKSRGWFEITDTTSGTILPGTGYAALSAHSGGHIETVDSYGTKVHYGYGDRGSGVTLSYGGTKTDYVGGLGHEHLHFMLTGGHNVYSRVSYGLGMEGFFSPFDMVATGYMQDIEFEFDKGSDYSLGDFSSRNGNEEGNVLRVPISGSNEFFVITYRSKVSYWDRVMTGDTTGENFSPYALENDYGKGLYIYHTYAGYSISDSRDMESATGYWNWEYAGSHYQTIPSTCFQSASGIWDYYRPTTVRYDNDPSDVDNPHLRGDYVSFHYDGLPKWWGFGKKETSSCVWGTDRIWVNEDEVYSAQHYAGNRYDPWKPGYNEVFSPYSSPSTKTWNNQESDIFVWFHVEEGGEAQLKIWKVDEEGGTSLNEILEATPPSRPMQLEVVCDESSYHPLLTWNHNMEPDMIQGGGFFPEYKSYKIYRSSALNMNQVPLDAQFYSENIYTQIATVDIAPGISPSYLDTSVVGTCAQIQPDPNNPAIEYPIRYRVQAVDKFDDESVLSDFASATGYRWENPPPGGGKEHDNIVLNTQGNEEIPIEFAMFQNYPNPFNPETNIKFDIPKNEFVSIKIFDITGREIEVLLNDFRNAGRYVVGFNASHLASGVYFYTIKAGSFEQTRRMILLK